MILKYTVSKDDYFRYCMYSYDHNEFVQKQVLRVRLLYGGLIVLATLMILIFSWSDHPLLYAAVLWVLSIILIANTKRSLRKTNEKQYRKQIEAGKGSEFIGEYTLQLHDDGIILSIELRESKIGYDGVTSIEQDEGSIYIYCGSMSAVLLPKTAFINIDEQNTFLDTVNARVSGSSHDVVRHKDD